MTSENSYSELYMYLNNQKVDETFSASGYYGEYNDEHQSYDQGSRTMVSHKMYNEIKLSF